MLTMHKRSGQAHSIDTFFPHRPKGNMAVPCPTCPEPMEEGWDLTDEDLKFDFYFFGHKHLLMGIADTLFNCISQLMVISNCKKRRRMMTQTTWH